MILAERTARLAAEARLAEAVRPSLDDLWGSGQSEYCAVQRGRAARWCGTRRWKGMLKLPAGAHRRGSNIVAHSGGDKC